MSGYIRSRVGVALVLGTLAAWWAVDQITDWSQTTMIAGVVAIAAGTAVLNRRVVR